METNRWSRVFLAALLFPLGAVAQTLDSIDRVTITTASEPGPTPTAAYLRLRHPLYLLDLSRQVKAGTMDAAQVAPLVGGTTVLSALLAMDLDALYQRLTTDGSRDPALPPMSLWSFILTSGGSTRPPLAELPETVAFGAVQPLDSPVRSVRITAPFDGSLQASLPADSAFRIRAMTTYDGSAIHLRRVPDATDPTDRAHSETVAQYSRTGSPWMVPVQAGQDVDVLVDLPTGTPIPPGGISTTLTLGQSSGISQQDVRLVTEGPLELDSLYVQIDPAFELMKCCAVFLPTAPSLGQQLAVPVGIDILNGNKLDVKGAVHLASGPAGLTMQDRSFAVAGGSKTRIVLKLYVEVGTPAANTLYTQQPFSLQFTYHSVPIVSAGGTAKIATLQVYPGSTSWFSSTDGNGFFDCTQSLTLFYVTSELAAEGQCTNHRAERGSITTEVRLGAEFVDSWTWNPFFSHWTLSKLDRIPWGQKGPYTFWITQPMKVTRDECIGFC